MCKRKLIDYALIKSRLYKWGANVKLTLESLLNNFFIKTVHKQKLKKN